MGLFNPPGHGRFAPHPRRIRPMHRFAALPLTCTLLACTLIACSEGPPQGRTPYAPSAAMTAVLAERQAMHAREVSDLSVERARDVPSLIDAAHAIPNVAGQPALLIEVKQFNQLTGSGAEGTLSARLYRPALAKDTPVILYFPGGTWATGSLDMYEDTARQLAVRTGWVVVSLRTRLAPETTFPGAHDDALAAYQWARAHLREWGADPTRVALAGEGVGANLALSTALAARDRAASGSPVPTPDHLLLITPLAGTELDTPSMRENGDSRPLTRSAVRWAQRLYAPNDLRDPRIDLVARQDFAQMPPTTVILAEIDPLRSGGEELAARMLAAGVPTEARLFRGTTHDFFGLGTLVPEAAAAEDYAAARLRTAFYRPEPLPLRPGRATRRVNRSRARR
ncbi:MAG: hypothetical protein NVSMB18_34140 [Acetobacteraceae bacterium]